MAKADPSAAEINRRAREAATAGPRRKQAARDALPYIKTSLRIDKPIAVRLKAKAEAQRVATGTKIGWTELLVQLAKKQLDAEEAAA